MLDVLQFSNLACPSAGRQLSSYVLRIAALVCIDRDLLGAGLEIRRLAQAIAV